MSFYFFSLVFCCYFNLFTYFVSNIYCLKLAKDKDKGENFSMFIPCVRVGRHNSQQCEIICRYEFRKRDEIDSTTFPATNGGSDVPLC